MGAGRGGGLAAGGAVLRMHGGGACQPDAARLVPGQRVADGAQILADEPGQLRQAHLRHARAGRAWQVVDEGDPCRCDRLVDAVELCARDRLAWGGGYRRRDHPYRRSEEHTSELQSLMRISYAVFCLKKKKKKNKNNRSSYDTHHYKLYKI